MFLYCAVHVLSASPPCEVPRTLDHATDHTSPTHVAEVDPTDPVITGGGDHNISAADVDITLEVKFVVVCFSTNLNPLPLCHLAD